MDPTRYESELKAIAAQYEREGYRVELPPRADTLPEFVSGWTPDAVAVRGEDRVVIEVRPNRRSLNDAPPASKLAEVVNAQPGWRFDLVILEGESAVERVAETAQEPTDEQFAAMLDRVAAANQAGLHEMALTQAWAAVEAAMRRLRDDAELYGRTSPMQLLSTLYGNGFINRDQLHLAREAWKLRTQVSHGFVTPPIDPATVDAVVELARSLYASGAEAVAG